MASATQAVIVIHRPRALPNAGPVRNAMATGGLRSFVVRIDGRRAGRVRPGAPAEFVVAPGEHTVAVSLDWFGSRPASVVVAPGSRTELVIGPWADGARGIWRKFFLPMVLASLVVTPVIDGLRESLPPVAESWVVRAALSAVVYAALMAGYVLATAWLVPDYWTVYVLEPAGPGPA